MERTGDPRADAEEATADACVPRDEYAIHDRAARGALNGGDAGRDVERQRRYACTVPLSWNP